MDQPSLVPLLRRWWKVLAAGGIIAGIVGYAWASTLERRYEAEVRLLSGPINTDFGSLRASGELARTYAELAESRAVIAAAAEAVGDERPVDDLARSVRATGNTVTRLVTIAVRDPDPEVAAALATALGDQMVQVTARPSTVDASLIDELLAQPGLAGLGPETRALIRQAASDVFTAPLAGRLSVVEPAEIPTVPAEPRVSLLVALATVAGLVVATIVALLRDGTRDASSGRDAGGPEASFAPRRIVGPRRRSRTEVNGDVLARS